MESQIKVTFKGNRVTGVRRVVSELVHTGTPIEGIAYEPEHIGRLSKQDVEEKYIAHSKFQQWQKSEARKEEIWNQILENRKLLKDIVLSTRHIGEHKIVRPLPQQVSIFVKACNSINKLVNSLFDHQSTPYSQIQQMQLV